MLILILPKATEPLSPVDKPIPAENPPFFPSLLRIALKLPPNPEAAIFAPTL